MAAELAQLAADVTPYVTAAAGAYGGAVLTKAKDEAAGATVALGRRLARRIFGAHEPSDEMPEALADVIADPEDPDNQAALRKAIRKALTDDEALATEVRAMVTAVRTGDHSVVTAGNHIGGHNVQAGSIDGGVHITDGRR